MALSGARLDLDSPTALIWLSAVEPVQEVTTSVKALPPTLRVTSRKCGCMRLSTKASLPNPFPVDSTLSFLSPDGLLFSERVT